MILSDRSLKKYIQNKELCISGLSENLIQSASIDLTLGNEFALFKYWENTNILDLRKNPTYFKITTNEFILPPHTFVLGTTQEKISLPQKVNAFVGGRSSVGRMGLFIQNAPWIAPGFKGQITLELYNANTMPIRLKAGHRICQIVLCELDETPQIPYQGKYQNQKGVLGSQISSDFENSL